ncbi:tRNA(5-methylaminomethyl-2-thiouridylate) methyltransferase [Solidesulfovibrio sp.]|uniref:tRNA(5-methylaminomethyl-2-thiouridylate) methyltransferase n=1 Tax=Solidesulfovibrio sp. TaxID=2910990 RepID=UPI00262B46C5|nr:tRNA(5-methylaminomethyl-2-thiouridylate) methyltransferase [Solidesulfovibrio sp.]
MAKAILLLSGGLDSGLAGKILLSCGIEVTAVNATSPFCRCSGHGGGCAAAARMAAQLGIPLTTVAKGEAYWEIVKNPRFGRGSGVNPCIDCRIHVLSLAREIMEASGALFVATGEVLGQRPMSQHRRALSRIERESGLTGRLLRPLSARLFPPTEAERQGIVPRWKLLAIEGRSRRPQMELARELALGDYPCPAGGCLLTDPQFSCRVREMLAREPDSRLADAVLLIHGRHFRLPDGERVVIGRNEKDNRAIAGLARPGDALLVPAEGSGPTGLCRPGTEAAVRAAAGLVAGYGKSVTRLSLTRPGESLSRTLADFSPLAPEQAEPWRIACKEDPHRTEAKRLPSSPPPGGPGGDDPPR